MRVNGQEVIRSQRVRWQYNRSIYRGEQYIRPSSTSLRTLAPSYRLPSGRRRDSVNRARRFIDGRASTFTMAKPNFGVKPEANTRAAFEAAELATKIVNFYWTKLDLATKFRHMLRMGDIDGVAFISVYYDRTEGDPIALPFTQDGKPISDPAMLIALEAEGIVNWTIDNTGDVCVRNVPIGRMAVDPLARENFQEARWVIESRIRPRADVENEVGQSLESLIKQSGQNLGDRYGNGTYNLMPNPGARISVDEFDDSDSTLSARDYILVHEAFVKPSGQYGDWPDGCHAIWLDLAPGEPILVEKWKYSLPYMCYVPQPDHGHFLKSRAVMDDLAPVQIALNRAISQYHELLDLYARLPIMAQRGALVTKFLYNDKRIVEYNPGFQQPNWMQAPPEPQRILENINFLLEQMAEISVQNDVSRGTPPGQGVEAGVSLNLLAQQNEQQLETVASAAKTAMEVTCTKILETIVNFFNIQRTIAIPGVSGVEEINNFVGSMLRGSTRVQVSGSILPRNQAAEQQTLITLATAGIVDIRPYLPQLTEGRVEEIFTDIERHEREQRRENQQMDLLASDPNVDKLWAAFQEMRAEHAQTMDEYRQAQANFPDESEEPGESPQEESAEGEGVATPAPMTVPGLPASFEIPGLPPPPPQPTLADIGVKVPMPQEWNDDALHSAELDRARCADGFMARHPLVQQAYHEHHQMHVARMAQRLDALAPQPGGPQAPPDQIQSGQPLMQGQSAGVPANQAANAPVNPASPTATGGPGAPSGMPSFNFAPGSITINAGENPEEEQEEQVPPQPPVVNVSTPEVKVPAPVVHVAPAEVHVDAPIVNVPPAQITVESKAPVVNIDNSRAPVKITVERDARGLISSLTMEEEKDSSGG